MIKRAIHKDFKLHDRSFRSIKELLDYTEENSRDVFQFLSQWFDHNNWVEVKTSGSTGEPKLIRLQKVNMVQSARATGSYFNLFENTTALLCMSPNYIAGKMMLVRALTLGWKLDIVEPVNNPLKNLDKHYHFSAMVPLQLHNSLKDIHKIELLIVGGGIVSMELQNKIQSVKTKIFATYGMTETMSHIAVRKMNNFNPKLQESKEEYSALPNVTFSIDHRNCLKIDAPGIVENSIVTNDLVELTSKTTFEWLGRFDNIINSGGIKMIPERIEDKLAVILKERFFVAGKSDPVLGEKLILIVEGKGANLESKTSKLVNELPTLNRFERPKQILLVEKFSVTATGKINRAETIKLLLG